MKTRHGAKSTSVVYLFVMVLTALSCTSVQNVQNPSSFQDFQNAAEVRIPSIEDVQALEPYDPTKPGQARIDYMTPIQTLFHSAVYSYYREHRVLPASLDELRESGWMWFEPASSQFVPSPEFVERAVQPVEQDLNAIEVIFIPQTGYDFAYVIPETDDPDDDSLTVYRWPKHSLIRSFEDRLAMFDPGSPFNDNDSVNIRITQMQEVCDTLVVNYWVRNTILPSSLSELLLSRVDPREDIFSGFPLIPLGDPGSFYFGCDVESGITYMLYVPVGYREIVLQKVYRENDTQAEGSGVIGRYTCTGENIGIENTMPLISSELPGWGFLDL